MTIENHALEEITGIVDSHLASLVKEDAVRKHLSSAFIDSLKDEQAFPFLKVKRPERVVVHDMYAMGDYDDLVRWGDSLLIACGWFPEWTSKKRQASLGMEYYVGLGIRCYSTAVTLSGERRARISRADPFLVDYLSGHFYEHSGTYFRLKEEVAECSITDYEVLDEFMQVFRLRPNTKQKIISISGPMDSKKKAMSWLSKEEGRDNAGMDYIPLDTLIESVREKEAKQEKKRDIPPYLTLVT